MQPPPPAYAAAGALPPGWRTATDDSGRLFYISPQGQTQLTAPPPSSTQHAIVRDSDGAISADLFGSDAGPAAAMPSYVSPMAVPAVGVPQMHQPTSLGMPPAAQPQMRFDPPSDPGVDALLRMGFGREDALAALRECGGAVDRAVHHLATRPAAVDPFASLAPTSAAPTAVAQPRAELDRLVAMGYSEADANAALDANETIADAADWLIQGYRARPSSPPSLAPSSSAGSSSSASASGIAQPVGLAVGGPALRMDEAQWDPVLVQQLVEMGFSQQNAVAALTANGGVVERAAAWLMDGNTAAAPAPAVAPAPMPAAVPYTAPVLVSSEVHQARGQGVGDAISALSEQHYAQSVVVDDDPFAVGGMAGTAAPATGGDGGRERKRRTSVVRKNASFAPFYTKTDHFTKTGSGQL
jgi:hypothetical protein